MLHRFNLRSIDDPLQSRVGPPPASTGAFPNPASGGRGGLTSSPTRIAPSSARNGAAAVAPTPSAVAGAAGTGFALAMSPREAAAAAAREAQIRYAPVHHAAAGADCALSLDDNDDDSA